MTSDCPSLQTITGLHHYVSLDEADVVNEQPVMPVKAGSTYRTGRGDSSQRDGCCEGDIVIPRSIRQ
ncbi:hypothetical protein M378DRAFT_173290 [Amanita muscaria Koide BX008]|uniref:Uncharacterized protein n=1 Tax=Amanita muscaria (strain Koide BX008) TaxID=946122 RepID=A0A0C2RZM2_AMAMK|nr:hypothetical protein M378DRAFT_173290 [Amanita muscaria Koide BX008]